VAFEQKLVEADFQIGAPACASAPDSVQDVKCILNKQLISEVSEFPTEFCTVMLKSILVERSEDECKVTQDCETTRHNCGEREALPTVE
jgi:hypothetical protein